MYHIFEQVTIFFRYIFADILHMCIRPGTSMEQMLTQPTKCIIFSRFGGHLEVQFISLSCIQGKDTLSCFFFYSIKVSNRALWGIYLKHGRHGKGAACTPKPFFLDSPWVLPSFVMPSHIKISWSPSDHSNAAMTINDNLKFHITIVCFGFSVAHPCHCDWLTGCLPVSLRRSFSRLL